MNSNSEKPFLSTGKLIENYKLLVNYMKQCRDAGLDCSPLIPSSDFLLEVKRLVESDYISKFSDLVKLVEKKFGNLISCDLALRVFTEIHGYVVSCDLVKNMLITQLAGWIIEMLETLGYVKIKFSWR
ncbi:MAG: hypothetical protein LM567_02130 [Desulfurococcaceae archaeon]|nr:hypothetical protein [Desulfurococcaceae archaeon]